MGVALLYPGHGPVDPWQAHAVHFSRTWGLDSAEIDRGVDGPSVAAVHFTFDSMDALGAALGNPDPANVLADVANDTTISPVMQTSEIVG